MDPLVAAGIFIKQVSWSWSSISVFVILTAPGRSACRRKIQIETREGKERDNGRVKTASNVLWQCIRSDHALGPIHFEVTFPV